LLLMLLLLLMMMMLAMSSYALSSTCIDRDKPASLVSPRPLAFPKGMALGGSSGGGS
jgi:hypothetical protein